MGRQNPNKPFPDNVDDDDDDDDTVMVVDILARPTRKSPPEPLSAHFTNAERIIISIFCL